MEAVREFGQGISPQDCQQNQIPIGQHRHGFPGCYVSTVVRIMNGLAKKEGIEELQRLLVQVSGKLCVQEYFCS